MKIVVIGAGFVGLSMAFLLAQYHEVTILDTDKVKIDLLNSGKLPIEDSMMINRPIPPATADYACLKSADWVIVAGPSDLDRKTKQFNTKILENIICEVLVRTSAPIVIKSTVPVGFTAGFPGVVLFSPEFLREGSALHDNLYPTRIIVGCSSKNRWFAEQYINMILGCVHNSPEYFIMSTEEAEAVKLFSNAYLAMRVAFFNELDSFALDHKLNTKNIIDGVCAEPRIGKGYNNPSFGYGGYCFPKDSQQLRSQTNSNYNDLVSSIVTSNLSRKQFIIDDIITYCEKNKIQEIGVYRLVMKEGSDNIRTSSILSIIEALSYHGLSVKLYEPTMTSYKDFEFVTLQELKTLPLLIANRYSSELNEIKEKVYTRDVFQRD